MSFSERFLSGFALAATVARDPAARIAQHGLAADIADAICSRARELSLLSKAERRARIRDWAGTAPPLFPSAATQPSRAFALLAYTQRAGALPDWVRAAPLPRPGYSPEPQLLALLVRICGRRRSADEADTWDA
jgi:hypothetical protein